MFMVLAVLMQSLHFLIFIIDSLGFVSEPRTGIGSLERKNPDLSSPSPRKSLAECPETSTLMIPLGATDAYLSALPLLMQLLIDKPEVSE